MSSDIDKQKHGERFFQKVKKLARKMKLAKEYGYKHVLKDPHKYHKSSLFSCGNPNCIMCMNPRKAFGEKSMQERRLEQKENFKDE
jgi:hypothetical protein